MSEFVQVILSEPVVESAKPATDEIIFDKLWLKCLRMNAPSPSQDARLYAEFAVCRDTTEGKELKWPEVKKVVVVDAMFATLADETVSAGTRTAITTAINQLLTALTMYGQEKGLI